LQAENEKLKTELADVKKDRDALKSGQQAVDRRAKEATAELARSNTQRANADQELTQSRAKMQELIGKFRETIQKLRETETEGATAKQALAARERELSSCVDHNLALYRLNDEVLTHYDKQGAFARMAQAEPFTKIKRIQNENLIDDYRARAQDQLVPAPKVIPGSAAAAPAVPHAAGPQPEAGPPPAAPPPAAPPPGQ
jgi:hypothetical protein